MVEQLNEPTEPTQMQIDWVFIKKLMLCISDCHYSVNRRAPADAVQQVRIAITEVKGDPQWSKHFKRMGQT